MGHHFDRQTAFEELLLVEVVHRRRLGMDQRVVEARVLVARQRAVQIIALAVVDAAGRCSWFDKLTTSDMVTTVETAIQALVQL